MKEKSEKRFVPCSCFSTRFSSCKIDDISWERNKRVSLWRNETQTT